VDSKGVIYRGRMEGMNRYKEQFAQETPLRTLKDALVGADVFLGCSAKDLVTDDMLRSMADHPIVFALANPDPEIGYDEAKLARPDAIVATGRSDFPNQVNNVLGFPYIFRGALDVRATQINESMKIAAANALAELAREPVPQEVGKAYAGQHFEFGPDYIIPKPFDPRLLQVVSSAVAKAACESGVAREPVANWHTYVETLAGMTSQVEIAMHRIRTIARSQQKRIVFAEGECPRVLEACRIVLEEDSGRPILIGSRSTIEQRANQYGLDLDSIETVDPGESSHREAFAEQLSALHSRDGYTPAKALHRAKDPIIFGAMMVRTGMADALVAGAEDAYSDTIRSLLPFMDLKEGVRRAAGFNILIVDKQILVFGDTTLQVNPDAQSLANIAMMGAHLAQDLGLTPRVAMLSFSNFGDSRHPSARKIRESTAILHTDFPDLIVDGEMHGDVAILPELAASNYPHSRVQGNANVLIFPDLNSANIAYKLVAYLGHHRESIGPVLEGLRYPVNVASLNSSSREIANLATISCFRACSAT